jgi:hypothetical protein
VLFPAPELHLAPGFYPTLALLRLFALSLALVLLPLPVLFPLPALPPKLQWAPALPLLSALALIRDLLEHSLGALAARRLHLGL